MEFIEYADREMLAIHLAGRIAGDLTVNLRHQERAVLAVPGGTSPGPIFDDLCAADLDWSRVDVVLTDERWVPESSPRSNTTLIRNRLLVNHASAARLLPLYVEGRQLEEAADEIATTLRPNLPLSVVLLGMGGDMHTASLFPDSPELAAALAADAPEALGISSPSQPEPRITLTAPVLNGALAKHLLIFGQDKREALEKAAHLPREQAPIAALLDGLNVHWAP